MRIAVARDTDANEPRVAATPETVKKFKALGADWDPDRYDDEYRKRLANVVKRKKGGKTIEAPKREETPEPAIDLMAALERSLAEVRG